MLKLIFICGILYVIYRFITHTPIDTRLLEACSKEDTIEDAFRLIESNPELINVADKYGITPLMLAAGMGDSFLVEELLKKGANVNSITRRGHTALMFVCMTNKSEFICRLLIEAGSVINMKSKDGLTALGYAKANRAFGLSLYLQAQGAVE